MQTLRSILRIGSGGTALTDEFGSESGIQLELMLGTACRLEFDLRGEPEKAEKLATLFLQGQPLPPVDFKLVDIINPDTRRP